MWSFHSSDAAYARRARREFTLKLRRLLGEGDYTRAEIVFGELLSNVVNHAPGIVNVWLDYIEGTAILYFHDSGSGFNAKRSAFGGLALARRLSTELGINRVTYHGGTQVRAVLAFKAA